MRVFLLLIVFVLIATNALAFTVAVSGTEVTVTYDEPTENEPDLNGVVTPLVDLNHTTIFHNFGASEIAIIDVPATSPMGGGTILEKIVVPVPDKMETDVDFWARACDKDANCSTDSPHALTRIDHLAPGWPK